MDEMEYRIAYVGAKDVSLMKEAESLEKLYNDYRKNERSLLSSYYERKLSSTMLETRAKIRKILEEC